MHMSQGPLHIFTPILARIYVIHIDLVRGGSACEFLRAKCHYDSAFCACIFQDTPRQDMADHGSICLQLAELYLYIFHHIPYDSFSLYFLILRTVAGCCARKAG